MKKVLLLFSLFGLIEVNAQDPCESVVYTEPCVTFDVIEHGFPNPDAYYFLWDFGDGNKGTGPKTTHCYYKSGNFTARLSLTNKTNGAHFEDELNLDVKIQTPFKIGIYFPDSLESGADFVPDINIFEGDENLIETMAWSVNGQGCNSSEEVISKMDIGSNLLRVDLMLKSGYGICSEKAVTMVPVFDYDTRYLRDVLHQLETGISWSGNAIIENENIKKLESVFFSLDEIEISDEMEPVLMKNVSIIKNYPNVKIVIGSFTHSDGDYDLNRSLSLKRSEAIRKYLLSKGVKRENFEIADPDEHPALENTCSDYLGCEYVDEGLNLRTDFKITRL